MAAARGNPQAAARSRARRLALQALYQWQMTATDPGELLAQFEHSDEYRGADGEYFRELVQRVIQDVAEIDGLYRPYLDRKPDEVDPVERAVLRLATRELRDRIDVPYRVVLNEAVALTRKFGAEQAHTFVNGVLDRVARDLRQVEYQGR
ncbi:transcription antitermination factor NusB [Thiohalobacter sp.]|uniref:transcription antitermination factor NusB n=1 Tax=Thiohalobacter sp. TaxID=2025948 RepID=UPI00261BBC4E|nr:transcription antitermination factor NusB [Thiohalobacter sp.]